MVQKARLKDPKRKVMNVLKFKTSVFCLLTAIVITSACEDEKEPLGPPQPADGGNGGADGGELDDVNQGGEGGILIDGEVPTCLAGDH